MPKKCIFFGFLLAAVLLLPASLSAQDNAPAPTLLIGTEQSGTLGADNLLDSYRFSGSQGDSVTLDLVTASADLGLLMFVFGPEGSLIAEDRDLSTPNEALIADLRLPQSGQYLVLVMRGEGAVGESTGTYSLTLSGVLTPPVPVAEGQPEAPAPPAESQTLTLANGGINISLAWTQAVNLNLEVRDPLGGSVFFSNPSTPSGGILARDVNADCATASADNPTETISWPAGAVPVGSYEILIYYLDGCGLNTPQQFILSVQVDGQEAQEIIGTLNLQQSYVAAVYLLPDATWTLVNGGVYADLNIAILSPQIQAATPLVGTQAAGRIERGRPAIAYTFEGLSGDTVNITMDRANGSLDTYLILLGPSGTEVARNDDRADSDRNSTITQTLTENGVYTIIATRYAQTIGGTEGDFVLNFNLTLASDLALAATPSATPDPLASPSAATPVVPSTPSASGFVRPEGLPAGSVEVILTWASTADIQLLVRDPSGQAVFDDAPTIASGGLLTQAGNARCAGNTAPLSYIYWPQSRLPRGIFEVEIWYQDGCGSSLPVDFTLVVNVQGQEIINTQQTATPNARFAVTFEVDQTGAVEAGQGGFFDMTDASSINYLALLPSATLIEYGETVPGNLTSDTRFQLFSFQGATGDRVLISMRRTGGTLDSALFLISPEGLQLAANDDIVNPVTGERDTNSQIEGFTLTTTGTHYIIATHYGLQFGGTTGTYELSLIRLPPR